MRKTNRNSRFKIYLIICLTITAFILAGCNTQQKQQGTESDAGLHNDTITVTDCMDRQVEMPAQVERIACLEPFSGYTSAMLGKGEEIIAAVDGMQRDRILTDMYPNIKDAAVPRVNGIINIEELIKVQPDIVFVKEETARNEGEVEKLNKVKIPYLVVEFNDMKEQQFAIDMIGQALGAAEQAKQYNEYYRNCIERVEKKVADIPVKDRVRLYHSVNEATRTDLKGTLPGDWTQAAGAVNVSVNENLKLLEGKHYASLEQILLWNPDVIIANEEGVADYILTNKQWSSLKAVKEHKVFQMPSGMSRWGHPSSLETPLATLWTAKTLYPDRFSDLDLIKETKDFYKTFFRYELSDEIAEQVLQGKGMRLPRHG